MASKTYVWTLLEDQGGPVIATVTWEGAQAVAKAPIPDAGKAVQSVVDGAKTAATAYQALKDLADALESPVEGPEPGKG